MAGTQTTNPTAYVFLLSLPRAHEDVYQGWLRAALSRFPYLRKGLVIDAICRTLVPELSASLNAVACDEYLRGWSRGYERGLKAAREARAK